tara:strand:- start:379 stop:783 length:405 start_codon:yes stop_codon:yes gene_type:complete
MELALVIYVIDLMSAFGGAEVALFIFLGTVAVIPLCLLKAFSVDVGDAHGDKEDELRIAAIIPIIKRTLICFFALIVLAWLTPSKETSYAMLAAYGVQTVAESEQVQEVAGKSLRVLEKYMDDYLEESSDKSEE